MDSLEILDLAMKLEEHYEIYIPEDDMEKFERVEDISVYLDNVLSSDNAT